MYHTITLPKHVAWSVTKSTTVDDCASSLPRSRCKHMRTLATSKCLTSSQGLYLKGTNATIWLPLPDVFYCNLRLYLTTLELLMYMRHGPFGQSHSCWHVTCGKIRIPHVCDDLYLCRIMLQMMGHIHILYNIWTASLKRKKLPQTMTNISWPGIQTRSPVNGSAWSLVWSRKQCSLHMLIAVNPSNIPLHKVCW